MSPESDVTDREAALLERLASADCTPWRGDDAPSGPTVQAAVRCQPDEGSASELTLVAFSDPDALDEAWAAHVDAIRPSLEETSTACDGSDGR